MSRGHATAAMVLVVAGLGGLGQGGGLAQGSATLSLSVRPSFLVIPNGGDGHLVVVNAGGEAASLGVSVASYRLQANGRVVLGPRREPARSAREWLRVEPSSLSLAPGQSAELRVRARGRAAASPGDHHAMVLLTSTPTDQAPGQVTVRTRIGVSLMVRVAGGLRRDLVVHRVSVRRRGPLRVVTVGLSNRGNVVERLLGGQASAEVIRNGRVVARLSARPRAVLAGTSGVIGLPYRGPPLGRVRVVVRIRPTPAPLAGPGIASSPADMVRTLRTRL